MQLPQNPSNGLLLSFAFSLLPDSRRAQVYQNLKSQLYNGEDIKYVVYDIAWFVDRNVKTQFIKGRRRKCEGDICVKYNIISNDHLI